MLQSTIHKAIHIATSSNFVSKCSFELKQFNFHCSLSSSINPFNNSDRVSLGLRVGFCFVLFICKFLWIHTKVKKCNPYTQTITFCRVWSHWSHKDCMGRLFKRDCSHYFSCLSCAFVWFMHLSHMVQDGCLCPPKLMKSQTNAYRFEPYGIVVLSWKNENHKRKSFCVMCKLTISMNYC